MGKSPFKKRRPFAVLTVFVVLAVTLTSGLVVAVVVIGGAAEYSGIVEPNRWLPLYAPAAGRVTECRFYEGAWISAGDLILAMDTTEERFRKDEAQRDIESLDREIDYASARLDGYRRRRLLIEEEYEKILAADEELYTAGSLSRRDIERSRFNQRKFRLEADLEENRLEAERNNLVRRRADRRAESDYYAGLLKTSRLVSPEDGFLLSAETVFRSEPTYLMPLLGIGRRLEEGQLVGYVIPRGRLVAKIAVPENRIGGCRIGQKALLYPASAPNPVTPPLEGRLVSLAPAASGGRYRGVVEIDAIPEEIWGGILKPGGSVTVRLHPHRRWYDRALAALRAVAGRMG